MTFLSYAQNQEDVMLYRALRSVERGFYIDVGAQHPVNDSVTLAFYERGWRGINVDPVPQWADMLKRERVHDINLRLALGAVGGLKTMFAVADTGLSTDNPAFVQSHIEAGYSAQSFEAEVSTLDEVCREYDVATVHFLKIDVEGAETDVILGFSFDRVRPWIVLIEAIEPVTDPEGKGGISAVETHRGWEPILLGHGYLFAYNDGLNRFYVAKEKRHLLECFATPPNPLDAFIRYQEWIKHERINQLDSELKTFSDASSLLARRAELESLDALHRDSASRLERIHVLEQENAVLHAQLATLHPALDASNLDGANRLMRIGELEQQNAHLEGKISAFKPLLQRIADYRQSRCAELESLDALRRDSANRLERIHVLEQENAVLHTRLATLHPALDASNLDGANRLRRIGELEQQNAHLEGKISAFEPLLQRMADYRQSIELEHLLSIERNHHQDIQSELDGSRGELALQLERSVQLEAGLRMELDGSRGELALQLERSVQLEADLRMELDGSRGELALQMERSVQLEAGLRMELDGSRDELALQLERSVQLEAGLRMELDGSRDELALQLERSVQLEAGLRMELDGSRDELALQLERSAQLEAGLRMELDGSGDELALQLERSVQLEAYLRMELDGSRSELALQLERSAQLEADLRSILLSNSWRLTRPLRWSRRALSGRGEVDGGSSITAHGVGAIEPINSGSANVSTALDSNNHGETRHSRAKRFVIRLARLGLRQPLIRRTVGSLVAVSPKTKSRLIAFIRANRADTEEDESFDAIVPNYAQTTYESPVSNAQASAAVNAVYRRMRGKTDRNDAGKQDIHEEGNPGRLTG